MAYVRTIRVCSLAAIASLVLVAFVGASSASAKATVLCKKNENPCSSANILPAGSYVEGAMLEGSGASFSIKTSSAWTYECAYALLGGQTSEKEGEPLHGHYESAGPYNCTPLAGGEKCSASSSGPNVPLTITASGSGNGTIWVGNNSQRLTFSFTCRYPFWGAEEHTCIYEGGSLVPVQFLLTNETLESKEWPLNLSGLSSASCGKTAKLNFSMPLLQSVWAENP